MDKRILKGAIKMVDAANSGTFDVQAMFDRRYVGKTWTQVMEENEYFDGETEIAAAAKARWREANKRAKLKR